MNFREKCEICFNKRRCKKDKHSMLFCLLTNCFEKEPGSYVNKQLEKLIGTFGKHNSKSKEK